MRSSSAAEDGGWQAGPVVVCEVVLSEVVAGLGHSEIVTETLDSQQWNAKTLSGLLSANPPWADGLPLAAEGWEAPRYKK